MSLIDYADDFIYIYLERKSQITAEISLEDII